MQVSTRKKVYLQAKEAQPPLTNCSWRDDICYYIDERKTKVGHLVIYIPQNSLIPLDSKTNTPKYPVPLVKNWVPIEHQTGGLACHHVQMYARFLKPTKKVQELIKVLNDTYLDSNIWQPAVLPELVAYNNILKQYGATAQEEYMEFQEAFYPIDLKHLKYLTTEKLPANLNDLFKSNKSNKGALRFGYRYHLAILGENCD